MAGAPGGRVRFGIARERIWLDSILGQHFERRSEVEVRHGATCIESAILGGGCRGGDAFKDGFEGTWEENARMQKSPKSNLKKSLLIDAGLTNGDCGKRLATARHLS